jgi:hypothetical protein
MARVVLVFNQLSTVPSRRMTEWICSSHVFLTQTLARGEWSVSRPCRFIPGKESTEPIGQGAGRTPESAQAVWRIEHFWLSGYTDCATAALN